MSKSRSVPFADKLARIFSNVLRIVYPPECIVCRELLTGSGEMCEDCRKIWDEARRERCPVCHKTARACTCLPFSLFYTDSIGSRKISSLAFYKKFGSDDLTNILVRRVIYSVKTNSDRSGVRFAARELSREILKTLALAGEKASDWKITYPQRSKKRARKYGFDQGRDLAREISRYTGIPYEETLENVSSLTQKNLNASERKRNAESSYVLKEGCTPSGKYFMIDDIITTGATLNAAALILKENGAEAVYPVCIARSKKKKRKVRRMADRPWFRSK